MARKPDQAMPGRARNARLNQAHRHAISLLESVTALRGDAPNVRVDEPDEWREARETLDKLVQCFHEASAYNNMVRQKGRDEP